MGPAKAACGWDGGERGELYGSADWEDVARKARVHAAAHAAGGEAEGRESCQRCLALMPTP